MKKLLVISLLSLGFSITLKAQTTTNIAYRISVETVTGGVTNTVNTNYRFDYGNKKDATRVDGVNFAYAVYVASLPTNQVALAIGPWLKQQHNSLVDNYAQQKQSNDNTLLLQKITSLLTANVDLLSQSDLNSLNTIAAKAP